jgi:hypothetical protein
VTKIGQGQPGAGETLAEMRGDMPGNFFAWILRYPEQDAVIIVLRNVYGSTEHLEDKLQAILFDHQPRLPLRSPKDMVARAWLEVYQPLAAHPLPILLALIFGLVLLWRLPNRSRCQPG